MPELYSDFSNSNVTPDSQVISPIRTMVNIPYFDEPFWSPELSSWLVAFQERRETFQRMGRFWSDVVNSDWEIHSPVVLPWENTEYPNAWLFHAILIPGDEPYYEDYYEEEMQEQNLAIVFNDGYSVEREDEYTADIEDGLIRTNIGRRVPIVSFEQEFSGDGDLVARTLNEAGLAYSRYTDGYHSSEGRMLNGTFCYVETDSSCGYELIFNKLDLTDRNTVDKLARAQEILKELKNDDRIRLSARCGFHIHVDVKDWGMKEIVSAYHLWNYLEDTVFRFASSFWATHRDEEVGGGYSTPVLKGMTGRSEMGHTLYERRDALNFSHILRAKSNCGCGAAIYEDWENCSCNLRQPTLEFRVFNGTMNQRKIKAYAAFCIAFVNMAKDIEHTPELHPEMRWVGTAGNHRYDDWEERTLERMTYILEEFPLTNSEVEDIKYCFRNCSLEPALEAYESERS